MTRLTPAAGCMLPRLTLELRPGTPICREGIRQPTPAKYRKQVKELQEEDLIAAGRAPRTVGEEGAPRWRAPTRPWHDGTDLILGTDATPRVRSVQAWRRLVEAVQERVLMATVRSACTDKERLERKVAPPTEYSEGDMVLVHWPQTSKWVAAYKGPYEVVGKGGFCPPFYVVAEVLAGSKERGKRMEVHIRRMRRYNTLRDPDGQLAAQRNIPTGHFVVGGILEHKEIEERPVWCTCNEGVRHLTWLIDWAGLGPDMRTWEPAESLTAVTLFKDFNRQKGLHWRALAQARCERKADRRASAALKEIRG